MLTLIDKLCELLLDADASSFPEALSEDDSEYQALYTLIDSMLAKHRPILMNAKCMVPESTWSFYSRMGIDDMPEQIELRRVYADFRKEWEHGYKKFKQEADARRNQFLKAWDAAIREQNAKLRQSTTNRTKRSPGLCEKAK